MVNRRQAIIRTNAELLLIGHCGTNFSELLIETQTFSFKKMSLKMLYGKWRPFSLGLNVLTYAWCGKDTNQADSLHSDILIKGLMMFHLFFT